MRTVRWIVAGAAVVALGVAIGFVAALVRPRHYAEFTGARQP